MAKTKRTRKAPRAKRKAAKAARRGRRPQGTKAKAAAPGAVQAIRGLEAYATQLQAERARIDSRLQTVHDALRELGAAAPRMGAPARGRVAGGPRSGSLKEFILKVLSGGGVSTVKEITEAVRSAGYPTKNKTLDKSVGIALAHMPQVHKVGRGKFRLK